MAIVHFYRYFRPNMPINKFKEAFTTSPLELLIGPSPSQEIALNITLGPPRISIGSYNKSRIEYIPERYFMQIHGPFNNMIDILNIIDEGFQKIDYDFDEIVRFLESQIKDFKVNDKNFSRNFRKMIEIKRIDQIGELYN